MTISDFIKEYNGASDDDARKNVIEKHIVNRYMPYADKIVMAQKAVKLACYKNGEFAMNTPMLIYLSVTKAIESYTDLRFSEDSPLADFDDMEKQGLCSMITDAVGNDYQTYMAVLDMTIEDCKEKESNVLVHVNQFIDTVASKLNFDKLNEFVEYALAETNRGDKIYED